MPRRTLQEIEQDMGEVLLKRGEDLLTNGSNKPIPQNRKIQAATEYYCQQMGIKSDAFSRLKLAEYFAEISWVEMELQLINEGTAASGFQSYVRNKAKRNLESVSGLTTTERVRRLNIKRDQTGYVMRAKASKFNNGEFINIGLDLDMEDTLGAEWKFHSPLIDLQKNFPDISFLERHDIPYRPPENPITDDEHEAIFHREKESFIKATHDYDILVLDAKRIYKPFGSIDGFHLAQDIKGTYPDAKILLISADDLNDNGMISAFGHKDIKFKLSHLIDEELLKRGRLSEDEHAAATGGDVQFIKTVLSRGVALEKLAAMTTLARHAQHPELTRMLDATLKLYEGLASAKQIDANALPVFLDKAYLSARIDTHTILDMAVAKEDYELAATIRDKISASTGNAKGRPYKG